jgi:hypothetical protein
LRRSCAVIRSECNWPCCDFAAKSFGCETNILRIAQVAMTPTDYRRSPADPAVPAPPPLGAFDRMIVAPVRALVFFTVALIALLLWIFPVLPIWLAMLLRSLAAFGTAMVLNLLRGQPLPPPDRLNYIVEFWVRGVRRILNYGGADQQAVQLSPFHSWQELLIACIFYLYIFTSIHYFRRWLWLVDAVFAALEHLFRLAVGGFWQLIRWLG